MDGYPNLYGDLSEPGGAIALTRDPEFAREFILRRADRLLFGSDYLAPGQQIPQFDILAAMNMPDEVQYKIHRGNAIRLLKLAGR
jgi:predicted TIM-barrel fold metal-dependent hydrolase